MDDLDKVNEERRKRGLPPLTRPQYSEARAAHSGSDDDFWHFIIAYATGFPMPSGMGVVGAILSPNSIFTPHTPAQAEPAPSYTPSAPDPAPTPSYSPPDPSPSPSYDSGSSYSGGGYDSGGSGSP